MTVNYTTNLALGLPVTGTESGTWGDDVNNAITAYLDIAIAGGLSVAITTADVTLTLTQGTSAATGITSTTAQYAILNISGAKTAARNLIVPSSSRHYIINNSAATGGYLLTVKGAATTGITLVDGEKAVVAWNGSDYVKIASNAISNSIGYGTGVATALAVNVGTAGAVVVNGGALGTPSSGSGSSLTFGTGTLSLAGNTTHAGAFTQSFTATANTAVTLPAGATAASNNLLSSATAVAIVTGTPSASTYLRGDGTWSAVSGALGGTVTSVGWTGGIVSVATATTTPAFTIAGTSGGIPYFSSGTAWASSAALAASAIVLGGGAGAAPATTTTGTGVVTALGVNVGSAGAVVVNGGVLGTPSSGTVTNLTGTASININGTVGATTPAAGSFNLATVNATARSAAALTLTAPAGLYSSPVIYTDNTTAASGTAAFGTINSIGATTIAASNATVTYTEAASLYIAGGPTAGTNVTITNSWAAYFGGKMKADQIFPRTARYTGDGSLSAAGIVFDTATGTSPGYVGVIGWGYTNNNTNTNLWASIAVRGQSSTGNGYGDMLFLTRSVTTDTLPTSRLVIYGTGQVLATSTAGLGYGSGAGGTVTQTTNISTNVTLNTACGQITCVSNAFTSGTTYNFNVLNSSVTSKDCIVLNLDTNSTTSNSTFYQVWVGAGATGSFGVYIRTNATVTNTLVLNFAVIKGSSV